jgi:serine/threonine protein kinase/tetratricopeptide (TPR) repeat protein
MSPERWQQIEAVFQSAVDLPPHERENYLDSACGADPDLRAEVRRLLSSSDSAQDFIESPIWTDSNFLNSSAKKLISDSLENEIDLPQADEFIGRRIGVYKLVSEIGRGGMGAVFLANRADGEFSQKVAIKLIKRGMDSEFIVRRFRHERQILASFEHPYIARLLDGGTTTDGIPYFVMEYIEGQTLYLYCDKQKLDIRARLKTFQKICSALSYAHERQIIHRDIKPSNILINKYGNPKLLDFGIAKVLDPDLIHESLNPTASIMRMMTPDYASPEQVRGDDITAASDIYSLGILLYELLTGRRPYNFTGRALHEVSRVICEVSPKLPSEIVSTGENLLPQYSSSDQASESARSTTAAELSRALRAGLDNVIMKALAKDLSDRYVSVKEFSEDISRYLTGRSVKAAPFVANDEGNGHRYLSVAPNTKALAILPFRFLNLSTNQDTDDSFLGLGLADALISRLSKIKRFVVRPTSSILSFGEDLIDPIRAGRELNVDFILDGNIKKANDRLRVTVQLLNVRDNAAIWATSIDEVLSDVFALEDTLSNKLIEVLLPQLTGSELEEYSKRGTENPEAFESYLRGRFHFNTFTEEGLAKAFVAFHTAIAADPNYAHAYAGIADYYNWLGIMGVLPPLECFQPAIEAASKAVDLDPELSEAHASLGFSLHAGNHDWVNAENHLRKAIELNPGNANAYVWYSIVLFTEGRFTDGLEFARRSVELDPLTPFNHHNIGWGLYYARRYDEAVTQYRRVTHDFPDYSFGYYGLSKIHRITGETKAALEESTRARQLMDDSVFSLIAEAESLAAAGENKEAKNLLDRLWKMSGERYVSPYQLALVYCYLDDAEEAFRCLGLAASNNEAWLNWMTVEPVFDRLREDKRFAEIAQKFAYPGFLENSASGRRLETVSFNANLSEDPQLHNLTTLMIHEDPNNDDGILVLAGAEKTRKVRNIAIASSMLLALIVAGLYIFRPVPSASSIPPSAAPITSFQNASIVVLPFAGQDDTTNDLGVGLADAITNKLGNIKSLQVISANTGRSIAGTDAASVGRELGISFVLSGKLSGSPENLMIHAELINVRDNNLVWSDDFPVNNGDLFGSQTKLAERTWRALGIEPLPLEQRQIYKSYTLSYSAYQLYLIGRFQMTSRSSENLRKAIDTFNRALQNDSQFAIAYVGVADCYSLLNLYDIEPPADAYQKALENVNKALAIDADLAEAHASLAYIKYYHEHDLERAELEFRRSLQLNPSYAQAHHWFALALAGMGRPVEAVTEAQVAQRLDPKSPSIKAATGIVYFMNRRYDDAIAECDKALELNKGFVPALKVKRWIYSTIGNYAAAMDAFQKEMSFSGGTLDDPGWKVIEAQIVHDDNDRIRLAQSLEAAINQKPVVNNDYTFAYEIALAYNALGDKNKAIYWLERAAGANSQSMSFVNVDPRIPELRQDPRLSRFLRH